ncbi:O-antigen polymerase [Streptococcus porcinus]|uniref:Oligosaccharide repeat unit polymerase n=1 Tax=Streptococcus porcinus TaxID=1340 RepID=A0A7V9WT76_STRPO|nr:O-antigen polymerase [Streptococcus porcinus]MBA2796618.1 oligosaccharide repeat unit polymerase [Streptococcus porcinus]
MIFFVILCIIVMLLLSVFLLKMNLSSPPLIYLFVWSSFVICSYLLLKENYYFSFYGIFWILTSCFVLILGYSLKIKHSDTFGSKIPDIPWGLLIFFIILSLIGFAISVAKYGISFNIFSNFNSLQSTSNMLANQRYSGGKSTSSILEQFLNAFTYVLPLCAGYSNIYANTFRKKLIVLSTLGPSILSMLVTSAKLVLVAYVMLFFVSYYTSYLYYYKKYLRINFKNLCYSLLSGFILYKLFYLSFVLRIGSRSAYIGHIILTKLGIYGFGHIQAFDIWLEKFSENTNTLGFGSNTFLSFSSLLGIMSKKQGIYDFINNSSTNVFTQYRALISDFGILCSLVIIFLLGVLLKYLYNIILYSNSKFTALAQVLFISTMFYLIYFIVSPWVYMTFILTFFIFYIFIMIAFSWNIKVKFR